MSRYKVMIDDNFKYMEEEARVEYGTVSSADEALDICRALVDMSLLEQYSDGQSAEALYERYTDFGKDPFVVALDGAPKVNFSAWTYARHRAEELTAPGEVGAAQRHQAVMNHVRRLKKP
jgi:hypothetical protein